MNNISELDFENSLHRRHSSIGIQASRRSVFWFQLSLPSNALGLRIRDGHFSWRSLDVAVLTWREDRHSSEEGHQKFDIQKESPKCGARCSKGGPIPSRKTDRVFDLRILPGDKHSRGYSWFLWSIQHNFTWCRCPRIWYSLGCRIVCQPTKWPRTLFWRAFSRCEYGSLISSKLCWHFSNRILTRRIHNQATRDWKPWWRNSWIRK